MPAVKRQFEFVNCTNGAGLETDGSLQKMRIHVMEDYFWRQGKARCREELNRRRDEEKTLPSPSLRRAASQPKPRQPRKARPQTEERSQHKSEFPQHVHHNVRRAKSETLDIFILRTNSRFDSTIFPRFLSLRADHLDPFNVLPMSNVPGLGETLKRHFANRKLSIDKTIPWLHDLNNKWQERLWEMARTERGILHTMVFLAERHKLAMQAGRNSVIYLSHNLQAIQAIRDRVLDPNRLGSVEALVIMVSAQVSRAISENDFETAKAHMQAVHRIAMTNTPRITELGDGEPILATNTIPFLYITRNYLRLASVTAQGLAMPLRGFPLPEWVPWQLMKEVQRRTAITLTYFPSALDTTVANQLISETHKLSLLLDPKYVEDLEVHHACNIVNLATYRLCDVLASPDLHVDCRDSWRPVDITTTCLLIFAKKCLPTEMLASQEQSSLDSVSTTLIRRIHKKMAGVEDIITYWAATGAGLESLLWILCVAVVTCSTAKLECLDWYRDNLNRVAAHLEISGVEDLERTLKLFP